MVGASRSTPASLPSSSSKVVSTRPWPILQCDNIFVLPGVPQFFAAKMKTIAAHYLTKYQVAEQRKIVLVVDEALLVTTLDRVVQEHPRVKFGSYPFVDHPEFKTIITLESADSHDVDVAMSSLLEALPPTAILRVERGGSSLRD